MTTMIGAVVQSSLLLLVALAVMPLLRRQSAALRHLVLATALLGAGIAPLLAPLAPAWPAPIEVRSLSMPDPIARALTVEAPAAARDGRSDAASAAGTSSRTASAGAVLVAIWLIGAALSLLVIGAGIVRLALVTSRARPVVHGRWATVVSRLSDAHGMGRPPAIRAIDAPAWLLVWGVRRPTLLVPATAESWADDRIAAVVDHELAHVRRRDWATQIATELVRAAYWFNPLVWIVCSRLRAECEVACDDTVVSSGVEGSRYASHLVDIARTLNTSGWIPAPAVIRQSTLERRVRAMLDPTRNRRPLSARARALATALILGVTLVVAGLAAQTFVSVSGTIVDPSNGVLPNVTLVLTNEQTGAKYEIKTDRTGRYEFVGVPAGTYTLEAALPGFARFRGRVTVGGQHLQRDVAMAVGMVEERINVRIDRSGTPPPPQAPDPDRQRRLDEIRQKRATQRCPEVQPGGDTRIGGNIRPPVKYVDVRPVFPEALRGSDGTVVLMAQIGVDGRVENIEVVSSPEQAFTDSAIAAVQQWEFGATLLNCEPIAVPMQVTVNYSTVN